MEVINKVETTKGAWHSHVSAVTVAPEFRRGKLAQQMMELMEELSNREKAMFVDLYVRSSNTKAVRMYEKMGYIIYEKLPKYYDDEIGYGTFQSIIK